MPTPLSGPEAVVGVRRWPARSVLKDERRPAEDSVCATIQPIHALDSFERWFDEFHLWTEGFEASVGQRARIQSFALEQIFGILDVTDSGQIAVTLSFGTVERYLDRLAGSLETNARHSNRLVIVLRGSFDRLRSRYRLGAFAEYLRLLQIPIGYLLATPRLWAEQKALDFLTPDFAKVPAPTAAHIEPWQDLALEARVAGAPFERLIVTGLDTQEQLAIAQQVGIPFGQGSAILPTQAAPVPESADSEPSAAPRAPESSQPAAHAPAHEGRVAARWIDLARRWNAAEPGGKGESPAEED